MGHPLKLIGPKAKKGRLAPEPPKTEDEVADLLKLAEESIKDAREARDREDYLTAWTEARRASRPLRILMRAHWEQAIGALINYVAGEPDDDCRRAPSRAPRPSKREAEGEEEETGRVPASCPRAARPCVAFNTLPQHYHLLDWLKGQSFGRNLVPSGSFDDPEELEESGWTNQSYQHVGITSKVVTEERGADQQRPAIKMKVEPADPKGIDALPPFLDFPAAAIRSPAIPVGAEYLYRISVLVKRPRPGASGVGGVIVRDSIGGEPLQFRWTDALPEWTKVVLFRRAPSDGELTVTLGLAGYGEAYFDDFKVEQVEELPETRPPERRGSPAAAARPPRPPQPVPGPASGRVSDPPARRSTYLAWHAQNGRGQGTGPVPAQCSVGTPVATGRQIPPRPLAPRDADSAQRPRARRAMVARLTLTAGLRANCR